jgi:hypothetical protein
VAVDIAAARSLKRFLESGTDPMHGDAEFRGWIDGLASGFRLDAPEYAHIFAPETYGWVTSPAERAQYIADRIRDLARIAEEI